MGEVRDKLEEYRRWGAPHVWLVDPHGRRMYSLGEGLVEAAALRIAELDIEVTPDAIFEA
jgi:Uma2 family endonuclease